MTKMTVSLAIVGLVATTAVGAHHGASALGKVQITQSVLADGKPLPPGTYEIRLSGAHVKPLPGQSDDAGQQVEFVRDGVMVANEVAEVFAAAERRVGTSGAAAPQALRAHLLRGGDFLRISAYQDGARYLIHLPVAGK
jgi:hypothetical protein